MMDMNVPLRVVLNTSHTVAVDNMLELSILRDAFGPPVLPHSSTYVGWDATA